MKLVFFAAMLAASAPALAGDKPAPTGSSHLIIQQNDQVFHVNGKDAQGNVANGYTAYERNTIHNPSGRQATTGPRK